MTIPQWASMGYWRKNQFALLYALSARLPNVYVKSFYVETGTGFSFALVMKRDGSLYIGTGTGPSKTKAKEACAIDLIMKSNLWDWLLEVHGRTDCAQHL